MTSPAVRFATTSSIASFDDGTVLFAQGRVHRLSSIDAELLELLLAHPVEHVALQVAPLFQADAAVVQRDLESFVQSLRSIGATSESDAPSGEVFEELVPRPDREDRLEGPPLPHVVGGFSALGWTFGVRTSDEQLGRYVGELFASFRGKADVAHWYEISRDDPYGQWSVSLDGVPCIRTRWLWFLITWLLWHVNQSVISATATHVLIHAAAVELRGRAIMLAGPMNAGKSTLAGALTASGCTYLTDEAVAFSLDDGSLEPYPRPLVIEKAAWLLLPELRPPKSWRSRFQSRQWHLAMPAPPHRERDLVAIIAPSVAPGSSSDLTPMGDADALELLCTHALNLRGLGAPAFDVLAAAVRGTGSNHRIEAGDLGRAVAQIRGLMMGQSESRMT